MQSPDTPNRSGTVAYEWTIYYNNKPEQVIVLDPVVLVRAQSKNKAPQLRLYYIVEGDHCTCGGWEFRHTCRHIHVAEKAKEVVRLADATTIDFMEERKRKRKRHGITPTDLTGRVAEARQAHP